MTEIHEINPIRYARLERRWVPVSLSRRAGVKLQTVYDHEKGVVAHCSPKIMKTLEDYELDTKLRAWQQFRRSQVNLTSIEGFDFLTSLHPMEEFIHIQGFTLVTFALELCIPRKSLLTYIRELQGAMPAIVRTALCETSLPVADVDRLGTLGVKYRDNKVAREVQKWAET